MWLFVMFDLPVKTAAQRKLATGYRELLLKDGFSMLQYSIYLRPCPSEENAEAHLSRARAAVPPEGHVRILQITDKQFGRMVSMLGEKPIPAPDQPRQLELF